MESWEHSLKKAIELDAEIDAYSLHVDPGTILEKMIKNGTSPPQGNAEYEKQHVPHGLQHAHKGRLHSRRT